MSAKANVDLRTKKALLEEIEQLRTRLDEAEQTLDAIRSGEVDALVVAGPHGDQVFSLTGSELTYRLIIETMNEAALTVGPDKTILFCNQRFCDLMKIPMQNATGQKITKFVATAQQRSMRTLLDDVQTGPAKRRLTLRATDGSPVSVQLAANLLVTDTQTSICLVASDLTELEAQAGSILVLREQQQALEESKAELEATNTALRNSRRSVLNVAEDAIVARRQTEEAIAELQRETAERKKAEEALRQSEALYRSIGESIDYGVWVCAPDGRNLYASESFLKMVGITQEQCSDFGWGDLLHPDDSERTIAAWQECVRTGGMWDIEHRFKGVDDQWHHVLARGVPIKNEQGEVTGWAGINLDIDRLKHVEENLRESEERLRQLGDNLPECVVYQYVHELNGGARFSYISAGIERLNGVTQEEVLQDASVLHRQLSPEFIERLIEAEAHSKRELKDFEMELPMHRPDGEVRWMQLRSRPRRMPDGRTVWDGIQTDITDRKRAEETITRQAAELDTLYATAPIGLCVFDADLRFVRVNQTMAQLNGIPSEQHIGRTLRELLSSELADEVESLLNGIMQTGQPVLDREVHGATNPRPEEQRDWLISYYPVYSEKGNICGVQGVVQEITDRKRAEVALKESEKRLRLAQESATVGIWDWSVVTGTLDFTPELNKLYGLPPGTIKTYQDWREKVHPDDIGTVETRRDEAIAKHKPFDLAFRGLHSSGEYRWIATKGGAIYDEAGRTVRVLGVNIDITERKQAEELLRLSEERFRGLVEQAPVGIFVADAQGHYIDVNPAGAQMLGYTHEEICRMGFADVLAPEEIAQIPEEVDRLADGEVHRHEWRFKRKDDSFFIGEVIGRQLPDGRLQGILRDVTENKKAEAMLKDMNEELELRVADRTQELANSLNMLRIETNERLQATEALREKERMLIQQSRQAAMGEMIGNIAHQWRQPLNTLGLHAQRLNLFYGSPNFNKEFLENSTAKTMEIIKHMSKTIDDFRNYFKPEKEKTVFNVIDTIKNTLSLLEGNLHNPPIAIDFVEHGNPVIKGYQNEFAQVFLNILNNARDAIIKWKITDPRITITICSEDSCTVVMVADNAGGIPDEIINKVFDPYFTTKGPQVGTGIGLFMSKTIIEKNMGGKLTVRNTDTGAEFRIEVEYGNQS